MSKLKIETEQVSGDRVKITGIKNALTRKELPREYTEHVPYMYLTDDSADLRYLIINWIGGIDHLVPGSTYPADEFQRIVGHIPECEEKLRYVRARTPETTMHSAVCPRCREKHADVMVRGELRVGWCRCGVVWLMDNIIASQTMK